MLCGQTILACMDTGMVFVMMSLNGAADGRFTTVELKTTFERAVPADVGDVTWIDVDTPEAHAEAERLIAELGTSWMEPADPDTHSQQETLR